ncbi:MAG TPA: rhomboid family intramembrane serine protease [Candidatus Scatomonas pullistercoris]|uniref:Rhomboid family intramembrane serine protease n=1 Tax=Candidatus Scatomonas pullistercoris TaxID=2840920 RepID=A0A9D1TAH0_9FIRM|nr:rhomboid family intramembrane serine protease [Candidatus Scatomonas pullistercoris]
MIKRKDKSWANLCLIGVNLLLFLLVELTGSTGDTAQMIRWGAAYTPLIQAGEYYRLFTCMFLHFGFQHLLNNMLLLFFLGDYVERFIGKVRYLILYLAGGFLASLFSYLQDLQQGQDTVSAGASGAVFAVLGGLIVLILLHRGRLEDLTLPRVLIMALLSLWVGFQSVGVDGFAHLGGFLAGAALMLLLKLPDLFSGRR